MSRGSFRAIVSFAHAFVLAALLASAADVQTTSISRMPRTTCSLPCPTPTQTLLGALPPRICDREPRSSPRTDPYERTPAASDYSTARDLRPPGILCSTYALRQPLRTARRDGELHVERSTLSHYGCREPGSRPGRYCDARLGSTRPSHALRRSECRLSVVGDASLLGERLGTWPCASARTRGTRT